MSRRAAISASSRVIGVGVVRNAAATTTAATSSTAAVVRRCCHSSLASSTSLIIGDGGGSTARRHFGGTTATAAAREGRPTAGGGGSGGGGGGGEYHLLPAAYRRPKQHRTSHRAHDRRKPKAKKGGGFLPAPSAASNNKRHGGGGGGGGRKRSGRPSPSSSSAFANHLALSASAGGGGGDSNQQRRHGEEGEVRAAGVVNEEVQQQQQQRRRYTQPHHVQRVERAFASALLEYRSALGSDLMDAVGDDGDGEDMKDIISSFGGNENEDNSPLHRLRRSERHYSDACRLLRRVVKGWSNVRPSYRPDGEDAAASSAMPSSAKSKKTKKSAKKGAPSSSKAPYYAARRAESFLDQYEALRRNRMGVVKIARHIDAERRRKKKEEEEDKAKTAGGVFGAIRSIFSFGGGGSGSGDDAAAKAKETEAAAGEEALSSLDATDGDVDGDDLVETHHHDHDDADDHAHDKELYLGVLAAYSRGGGYISSGPGGGAGGGGTEAPIKIDEASVLNELERFLDKMNSSTATTNMRPGKAAYHLVLGRCASSSTMDGAERAERLLRKMVSSSTALEDGKDASSSQPSLSATPDLRTYHHVLRAYRNAASAMIRADVSADNERRQQQQQQQQQQGRGGGGGKHKGKTSGYKAAQRRAAAFASERLLKELEEKAQENAWEEAMAMAEGKDVDDDTVEGDGEEEEDSTVVDETGEEEKLTAPSPRVMPLVARRRLRPNAMTYNLVLKTLCTAGHGSVPNLCQRVDDIATRIVGGPEAFGDMIDGRVRDDDELKSSEGSTRPARAPDPQLCHHLVDAYASSDQRPYIDRAKRLLESMIERRSKRTERAGGRTHKHVGTSSSSSSFSRDDAMFYPNTQTFNSVIRGLLYVTPSLVVVGDGEKDDFSSDDDVEDETVRDFLSVQRSDDKVEDAAYATNLLDSMVEYESSHPSQMTYYLLLSLWSRTRAPEAGERAEEILSRLEVRRACHQGKEDEFESQRGKGSSPRPDLRIYNSILLCWNTSALARQPQAAQRASRLLDRLEAQSRRSIVDRSGGLSFLPPHDGLDSIYDETLRPDVSVYNSVIRVASCTRVESEMQDAFAVGIDAYNRMLDRGIKPSADTYACLLNCCDKLLPGQPEKRMEYSQTVFEQACNQRLVNNKIRQRIKKVNYPLYQSTLRMKS